VLAKRKKISKKEMKEDKLVTSYYKVKDLYSQFQSKVLIAVGVIVVLIVAVILIKQNNEKNDQKANALIAKVMPLYEANQYREAIDGKKLENISGLKQIVEDYGSTNSGEMAKLYLANAYYYLGEFENALKYYKSFSGTGDEFKAAAYAGIAACAETKKDTKEAADYYKKAASVSKSNYQNAEFLLKAGINLMASNQMADARDLFLKIKEDYKTSVAAYEVDKYLTLVDGKE